MVLDLPGFALPGGTGTTEKKPVARESHRSEILDVPAWRGGEIAGLDAVRRSATCAGLSVSTQHQFTESAQQISSRSERAQRFKSAVCQPCSDSA